MPLSPFVQPFRDGVVATGTINALGSKMQVTIDGHTVNNGIACHQATFLWCYRASHHGAWPSANQFLQAQTFVNSLILMGHPTRITEKTPPVDGDVLIFTAAGGQQADHSCVALGGGRRGAIAGYNQPGWFSNSGHLPGCQYSVFPFDAIVWQQRAFGPLTRRRAMHGAEEKYLWAVREGTALAQASHYP